MDERPGQTARLVGALMVLASFGAGAATREAFRGVGHGPASNWHALLTAQLVLTAVWLFWSGIQLVRRVPWREFRMLGTLALAAGIVGLFANLPHSFQDTGGVDLDEARAFLTVAATALFGGLGHRHAARNSGFAPMLHSAALFGPILLGLSLYASYTGQ